jgi:hypothetical protein
MVGDDFQHARAHAPLAVSRIHASHPAARGIARIRPRPGPPMERLQHAKRITHPHDRLKGPPGHLSSVCHIWHDDPSCVGSPPARAPIPCEDKFGARQIRSQRGSAERNLADRAFLAV